MKNHYLNFLDEPHNSERRHKGRGIYTTYSFGDKETFKTVRVILLDVRYDKTLYIDKGIIDLLGIINLNNIDQVKSNGYGLKIHLRKQMKLLSLLHLELKYFR